MQGYREGRNQPKQVGEGGSAHCFLLVGHEDNGLVSGRGMFLVVNVMGFMLFFPPEEEATTLVVGRVFGHPGGW
jgi:hypothetical protein